MDINIIAGRSSETCNEHIFSLLKNRDKTKNHVIIAPDRSQFSIEKRLFEETQEKCFFDINVISLSRLAKKIIFNKSKNVLTKQSGVALVKKLLEEQKDNLHAFKKATSFMGFAETLFETICFYKSCNVTPENIYVNDSTTFSNLKQKDIKLIYSKYEDYLKNDFTDSFNQLRLFADSININSFPNTIFYFIEFDDFTRIMYDIISKLARFLEGIYVCCTYGKEQANANIYSQKVYYDLIDLFKFEGLDFKINKIETNLDKELDFLTSNILSYSNSNNKVNCSKINLYNFNNAFDEVKYILSDIYSKAMEENITFDKFAIVVPDLSSYKNILKEELINYDLKYYFDESKSLKTHEIIKLLFSICNILIGEYKRSDFSFILKSPLLNFDNQTINDYDSYLKRIGAISDMCLNYKELDNEDVKFFVELIKELKEHSQKVITFSHGIGIIEKCFCYINQRSQYYYNQLSDLEKRTFDQVSNKVADINKDALSVFGSVEFNYKSFLEIYYSYYESSTISMPPITSNTLFIADFNTSYINKVDYLYVLGNNEGKLPKQKLDNGLVTDEELKKLPNAKQLTPTIAMLNARKVFKLYEILFKFRKTLYLSCTSSNSEGKLYPNNFINSISKLIGQEMINYSGTLDIVSRNFYNIDINNLIFNNLTQRISEHNFLKLMNNWDLYEDNENYRKILASLYEFINPKLKDNIANLNNKNILENLKNSNFISSNNTSISQIECFNKCPYMHFVKYGLRLNEDRDNTIQPIDIGNILHEVLSIVVSGMAIESSKDTSYYITDASRVLEKTLNKDIYSEKVKNPDNAYVVKALYRELERIIEAIYNEISVSSFKPKYCEYKFDNISVNDIKLKGFIDRIDISGDNFIVIDYKTGDNEFKNFNDVYSGKKLQLLVYSKAFATISGLKPRGAFYLPISNAFGDDSTYRFNGVLEKSDSNIIGLDNNLAKPNYKSQTINLKTTNDGKIFNSVYYKNLCLEESDFDYLLDYTMKQVEKTINRIKLGYITPNPIKENGQRICRYCSYKAICNYQNNNDNVIENIESIEKLKDLRSE